MTWFETGIVDPSQWFNQAHTFGSIGFLRFTPLRMLENLHFNFCYCHEAQFSRLHF